MESIVKHVEVFVFVDGYLIRGQRRLDVDGTGGSRLLFLSAAVRMRCAETLYGPVIQRRR